MSLVYFLLWVILSGRVTSETIIAGIILSILLDLAVKKFLHINFTSTKLLKLCPDVLFYITVLLIEVLKANMSLTRIILSPEIRLEPCLVKFSAPLKSPAALTALADSISLMPGTVTVSLEGNKLLVHALDRNRAEQIREGILVKLLSRMEKIVYA